MASFRIPFPIRLPHIHGFLTLLVVLCSLASGVKAVADEKPHPSLLRANGTVIEHQGGKAVHLRGVNLGGWLEWQEWMCPMDSSKTLRDANPGHNGYNFELRKLLVKRFGPAVARDLIDVYLDSWITTADLDNIRALGTNAIRLPIGYDTLCENDGTPKPDGFKRIDWLVREAWKRGIYTIIDYHSFLPPAADQNGGVDGYWKNEDQKKETIQIWTRIATRYRGNPAVAMYDLLNEPTNSALKGQPGPNPDVVCSFYDELYHAIRAVDADHLIAMEGMWDWKSLRDPSKQGYQNVVYSFHWYDWGAKTTEDRKRGTDRNLESITLMEKTWNIPTYIGEFNLFGDKAAWQYALDAYDKRNLAWTLWTYKNKASGTNSWGVYTTIEGKAPAIPHLTKDTAEEIRNKWKAWETNGGSFAVNPMLKSLFIKDP